MLVILGFNLRTYGFHLPYKLGFIAALCIQRIATEPQLPISANICSDDSTLHFRTLFNDPGRTLLWVCIDRRSVMSAHDFPTTKLYLCLSSSVAQAYWQHVVPNRFRCCQAE